MSEASRGARSAGSVTESEGFAGPWAEPGMRRFSRSPVKVSVPTLSLNVLYSQIWGGAYLLGYTVN